MKRELNYLRKHYKTNQALANELGITDRHLRYVTEDTEKASKHLKKLIVLKAYLLKLQK